VIAQVVAQADASPGGCIRAIDDALLLLGSLLVRRPDAST
jgi:hypothetical protein